jgi:hypothetical protein
MSTPLGEKESFQIPVDPPPPESDFVPPSQPGTFDQEDIPDAELFSPSQQEEETVVTPIVAQEKKEKDEAILPRVAPHVEEPKSWQQIIMDFCRTLGKYANVFCSIFQGEEAFRTQMALMDLDGPKDVASWQRPPWEAPSMPRVNPALRETFGASAKPVSAASAVPSSPNREAFSAAAQGNAAPAEPERLISTPAIPIPALPKAGTP